MIYFSSCPCSVAFVRWVRTFLLFSQYRGKRRCKHCQWWMIIDTRIWEEQCWIIPVRLRGTVPAVFFDKNWILWLLCWLGTLSSRSYKLGTPCNFVTRPRNAFLLASVTKVALTRSKIAWARLCLIRLVLWVGGDMSKRMLVVKEDDD